MPDLFGLLSAHLAHTWKPQRTPELRRKYRCRCGRAVFFRNSVCLACKTPLGFWTGTLRLHPLRDGPSPGSWLLHGSGSDTPPLRRCVNFDAVGCNWLLTDDESNAHQGLCRACRLNRTIPDLADADNRRWWRSIEIAKRRLVSELLGLSLVVRSKVTEDAEHGLMFDFLRSPPGGPAVMTGHADGLITLNVEEADDARREHIRTAMCEPYRALLGHLRHEVGHYYWDRLVRDGPWLEPFRQRFGDERTDYGGALKTHYAQGPAIDWPQRCVTSYAASHPWEDWAETFAHYLHMIDTVQTALSYGLEADDVEVEVEPYGTDALDEPDDPGSARFLGFVNAWLELTMMVNELSRSMGQPDFYPFVLSRPAVAKLHFVHRVISAGAREPLASVK
ncbi:MAG TPA: putative zinc-binding metallopeptidase [Burkholderiaceae bacterium]|nr:putative zinc-binding metallopeptidase [Burkholderiaceae bacterium]